MGISGGYFVTEEAEKAKKWDMVERHGALKSHEAVLEDEIYQLGSAWVAMGEIFKNFSSYSIVPEAQQVKAYDKTGINRTLIAELPLACLDSKRLLSLLEDLSKTQREKSELETKLRNLNIQFDT